MFENNEQTVSDRDEALTWAEKTMAGRPIFLDTETTGLDDADQVCDIAVVDFDGVILFETLVKPTVSIPRSATAIHGIDDQMVKDAPAFGDIAERLAAVLDGRQLVVIYNAAFDRKLLRQSARAVGLADWGFTTPTTCAMTWYAQFWGDWNDYHGNYKWQSLSAAARGCGLKIPDGIHRARVDCELTRQVVKFMAGLRTRENDDEPGL